VDGTKAGESLPDRVARRAAVSSPEVTGPRTEIAANGAPGGAFPPIARRKGDAFARCLGRLRRPLRSAIASAPRFPAFPSAWRSVDL
jgi:hypothetical protein